MKWNRAHSARIGVLFAFAAGCVFVPGGVPALAVTQALPNLYVDTFVACTP